MQVYFYLYSFTLIMLLLSYKPFLLRKDIFYFFTILFLIIISGLRYQVGVDYNSYDEMFYIIRDGHNIDKLEPITYYFVNFIDIFGLDNQFIFLIYSTITLSGVGYFIYKLSPHKELSIFLFLTIGIFYFSTFNAMRQWLAISFILISIVKSIEYKNKQSLLFLILAFMSHYSVILFICLFPFLYRRFKLKTIIFIIGCLLLGGQIIIYIISLTKFGVYLEIIKFSKEANILLLGIYSLVILFFPIYFKYFIITVSLSRKMVLLLNMNLISFSVMLLGYGLGIDFITMMRVNMYFQIQLIILIPIFLYSINNLKIRFLLLFIGICFTSIYYLYLLYIKGSNYSLTPYKFIFWS